ncbi:hypothetical protein FA13DRAFT_1800698 [Coprinellus micaceus]|uniref:Uncharacterized protein n=1 Tax=Coprinellus micaceus TaxID=71717 RepID=A0A4Y7SFY0_COPMI|nr:hypothetical protein FA13DRAFT_1800698 [Coprinellus micaceus]
MSVVTTSNTMPSFPAPQPTRKQLIKSTRKLQAVLGTTPMVLELDLSSATHTSFLEVKDANPRPPVTPRTRAQRRRGQVFQGSSSSTSSSSADELTSDSSGSSSSDEEDKDKTLIDDDDASYVFVPTSIPKAGYTPFSIPTAVPVETIIPLPGTRSYLLHDPNPSKRARSNTKSVPKNMKSADQVKEANTRKRSKSEVDTTSKPKSKPTPLAQPVLFRLRSTPRPLSSPTSIAPSTAPPLTPPRSHRKTSSASTTYTNASREPLSPLSQMFSNRLSMMPEDQRERKEKEMRRKKMDKVKRTLGENVPPELVFRPTPPVSAPVSIPAASPSSHQPRPSDSTTIRLPARKTLGKKHRPRSLSVPIAFSAVANVEIDITPAEGDLPPLEDSPAPTPRPLVVSAPTQPPRPLPVPPTRARSHSKSYSTNTTIPTTTTTTTTAVLPIAPSPGSGRGGGYYSAHDVGTTIGYKGKTERTLERTAFATLLQGASPSASVDELGVYTHVQRHPAIPPRSSSLDLQRPAAAVERSRANLTPITYVYGAKKGGSKKVEDVQGESGEEEWRRKEREWSGEWNVHDMGDVVRRLRGLKAA